jgi:hypothetical protein
MLRIDDIIFSLDIIEKKFRCDLSKCLGNCCRYGDSGAPVSDEEAGILDEIWPEIRPYLRPEGINEIEKSGTSTLDFEHDQVTPLINNEECAYTILSGNVYMCGIEKAWQEGKIRFRKPLSCHLFPARVKKFSGIQAVNFQELSICATALERGSGDDICLHRFLREPLIRAFGEDVYNDLDAAAVEFGCKRQNRK